MDFEYRILGKGDIDVLIELGIGCSFYNWMEFVRSIQDRYRVILYHRLGYGNSADYKSDRTIDNIALELDRFSKKVGLKNKFILIGHSFGGLCSKVYSKFFPYNLKGLILLDSTPMSYGNLGLEGLPVLNSKVSLDNLIYSNYQLSKSSESEIRIGNKGIINGYDPMIYYEDLKRIEKFFSNPRLHKTIAEEFKAILDISTQEKDFLSDVPTIIICRDPKISIIEWVENDIPYEEASKYEENWLGLQKNLRETYINNKFIIAINSGHEIHKYNPKLLADSLNSLV